MLFSSRRLTLTSGIEPPVKPTTTQPPVRVQRAQAVGEAVAADRVEIDVGAAERLDLVLPGPSERTTSSAPGVARHLLLLVAGDDRDRARAEALGHLQRRGADAARGAVHEHRLALGQPPAGDAARSTPCGS